MQLNLRINISLHILRPSRYIYSYFSTLFFTVERMVQKWAPLVWLAPGEKFFPSEVPKFLRYVTVRSKNAEFSNLPVGPKSEEMFLVTKSNIGKKKYLINFKIHFYIIR